MKKLVHIIIGIAITMLSYGCDNKNRTAEIVESYKNGEISEDSLISFLSDSINRKDAFDWANKNKGDKDYADFILGLAYNFGWSVDRDPIKSKAYYRAAALNGNLKAMNGLGAFYSSYPGYEDLDSAYYWFNEAIKKGDAYNYINLAMLEGKKKSMAGLPVDTALIVNYIEKGASLKDPHCTSQLAGIYLSGFGVKKDANKAYILLSSLPEDKLDNEALFLLGQMYELGDGTPSNFNEAFRLIKKSANLGNTNAICKLGNFYQFGQGVAQNDSLAFIQYKKAANAGNPWGMRCIGNCYMNGIGVTRNIQNALVWYKSAAKNGDLDAIDYCEKNKVDYK